MTKKQKKNQEIAILRGKRLKSALDHYKLKNVDITITKDDNSKITESQVSDCTLNRHEKHLHKVAHVDGGIALESFQFGCMTCLRL